MKSPRCVQALFGVSLAAMLACNSTGVDVGSNDTGDSGPPPIITEFLARNQAGILDEDGDTSDWIELHNPHTVPLDLSGYHLTDSASKPQRWTFPDGTMLQPGAYMLVFASGKNRAVVGQALHANFSLDGGGGDGCASLAGEYLAVTNRKGVPIAPFWSPYPAQFTDVSHGLLTPDSNGAPAYFATPTPGAPNDTSSALAERVVFTPRSSTFSAGSLLAVNLAVTSKTATIRYTTNRSRPIGVAGRRGTFMADAATDVGTLAAHGFNNGDVVRVTGPAPLVGKLSYFVKVLGADTFKLTIEPGGPTIDFTASGSFEIRRDAVLGTAAATDIITTAVEHGFFSGDAVQVSTTGTLPGGVAASTTYYVVSGSSTTFQLSSSPTLTPIVDILDAGMGTHTIFRMPSPVYSGPIGVTVNTRVRARAFEPGRPDGPLGSEMYYALDAAAQSFSSSLPVVISHTWNTAMANDTPVDGHIMIFEPQAPDYRTRLTSAPVLASPCSLERHGSSTGGDPKFSMALELQDEFGIDRDCSPFGMPANSDWLMHAPYKYDRSMMHNDLIYRISNDIGRYAVKTRFFEHIHNETSAADTIEGAIASTDYFGLYSFMEKITRGKDRVDVENLTILDNTAPTVEGGYMFKFDRLDAGESGITPLAGQSFGMSTLVSPDPGPTTIAWVNPREVSADPFKVVTAAQSTFLRGHLGAAWAALNSATYQDPVIGYAKYWDVAAVVDHHILNTATKNADGFRLSSFWHKPRAGKLTAGPIWDFDRAMGSTDPRDFDFGTWNATVGTLYGTNFFTYPWYKQMLTDPNFWQLWIDRLHKLRQGPLATAAIHSVIDGYASQLNPGNAADTPAKRTIQRWPVSVPRSTNSAITNNLFDGTYPGEVAWLKYWWTSRLAFMDSQVTRPAVANLPEGKVPAGAMVALSSPSQTLMSVKIYYTIDGSDPRLPQPGPMLSTQAVEYTGPIAVTAPIKLFVRVWNPAPTAPVGSGWSAPTLLSYSP